MQRYDDFSSSDYYSSNAKYFNFSPELGLAFDLIIVARLHLFDKRGHYE